MICSKNDTLLQMNSYFAYTLSISIIMLVGIGSILYIPQNAYAHSVLPITLTPIGTPFNSPIGIDHHQPTNKVVMSVHYSNGQPYNFELVAADGSRVQFSAISGFTDEVKIATVRDTLGGFTVGELFTGTGVPGNIARIASDGSSFLNPWVNLPGEPGLMRGSLHVDRTGVWNGDLIAVTTAGGVWRINSAGIPTQVTPSLGTHLEGLTTVPNDVATYGPWAGRILAGAEGQGRIYAIDTTGDVDFYTLDINPEDFDIIPANENFFGVNFAGATLMGAPPSEFADKVGNVLVTQESHGISFDVHWDAVSNSFHVTQIAQVAQWEHVTFSTAGIREIPPTQQQPVGGQVIPVDMVGLVILGMYSQPYWLLLAIPLGAALTAIKLRKRT